jgi:3-oxoacyl-[acyl-carrier protein] reductase
MVDGQQKVCNMNLNLKGKKILITGASRGIGLAIAESSLQEGAKTCLVSRGSNTLSENEEKLQNDYGSKNTFACKCDCSNIESLNSLRIEIGNRWNGLEVLIVNVGDGRSVSDALPDDEQWKKTWNSNFESALQTARTFLPMLKESKGALLFISSIAGLEAIGAPTDYSVAKSALISLTKQMARRLAPKVRVNCIAPGNIYFEGGSWDEKKTADPEKINKLIDATVPMNRFGTPDEIADAALFLCSDRASFITGSVLVVDGGQTVGIF